MTWMWVVAFGVMFVSAMIPPIVDGDATILDMDDPLSIVCYWVLPFTVLGIAAAVSAAFPPWFDKRSAEVDQRGATAPRGRGPATGRPADVDGLHHRRALRQQVRRAVRCVDRRRPGRIDRRGHVSGIDLFGRLWKSQRRVRASRTTGC